MTRTDRTEEAGRRPRRNSIPRADGRELCDQEKEGRTLDVLGSWASHSFPLSSIFDGGVNDSYSPVLATYCVTDARSFVAVPAGRRFVLEGLGSVRRSRLEGSGLLLAWGRVCPHVVLVRPVRPGGECSEIGQTVVAFPWAM